MTYSVLKFLLVPHDHRRSPCNQSHETCRIKIFYCVAENSEVKANVNESHLYKYNKLCTISY